MPDAEPTVIALAPAAGKRMGATPEVVVLRHLGPVAEAAQQIQQSSLNGAPSR